MKGSRQLFHEEREEEIQNESTESACERLAQACKESAEHMNMFSQLIVEITEQNDN